MRAERGIALPTVIILLLLTASAAGWILYFKNQRTLADMAAVESNLSKQIKLTTSAEDRANALQSELDETNARVQALDTQVGELNTQLTTLREENTAIARLESTVAEKNSTIATMESRIEVQTNAASTLQTELKQMHEQAATLQAELDETHGLATSLQTVIATLESDKQTAATEITALAKARDEAIGSDQRGRTQLAELLAQVESGQQNSAEYLAQLEAARTELATTSEQADLLQQRLQALEAEREKERAEFRALQEKLNAELGKDSVNIDQSSRELTVIRLQDDVLFNSGSARLLRGAQGALSSISGVLQRYPDRLIQVEGHTDNIPLSKQSRYPTNWELSAARASAAVRYLINSTDIDPQRLRVAGLGEYNPIADNSSADGRAQNRRIEITLLPANALREVSAASNN